ncbi:MAG: hypothetical protein JW869_05940 [Candidatus Omnitrophica bacterium]|nr:hypothetical protein [Candidatus Omnitrophota bacterium]
MKKILLILALVLVAVYVALTLFSSNDDYSMEKAYFEAIKEYHKIVNNPDVAPPAMLSSVENKLKDIIERFPNNEKIRAVKMVLAEFYLGNKEYDKALGVVDHVLDTYGEEVTPSSQAQFLKGLIYERQGLWPKAKKEYLILRDNYTETPIGFQVPLYIGNYHKQKGDFDKADQAHREAVEFYSEMEVQSRGKVLGYVAANMLLQAQMELKDYLSAEETLLYIIDAYPSDLTFGQQLIKVEEILIKHLKSPEKAMAVYQNMKNKTKNDKLIALIDQKIAQLGAPQAPK